MILAAGFGKRIQPLTLKLPKPLLKMGEETLLSNTIKFLESYGVKQIVINTHYLREQITNYVNKNVFKTNIFLVEEKNEILDTGGGVLNAINYFKNDPFFIINPDTIWSLNYLSEIKKMETNFFENEKCLLLLVNKKKSYDKSFKGDFNLSKSLVTREKKNELNYIYTGIQIITPDVFKDLNKKPFSINKIWDKLIKNKQLYGNESNIDFLHVSTLDIYNSLIKKF